MAVAVAVVPEPAAPGGASAPASGASASASRAATIAGAGVTADDGSFASGLLAKGDSFTHTFDRPGVYAFTCTFHGRPGGIGMAGIVVVGDAAAVVDALDAVRDLVQREPAVHDEIGGVDLDDDLHDELFQTRLDPFLDPGQMTSLRLESHFVQWEKRL